MAHELVFRDCCVAAATFLAIMLCPPPGMAALPQLFGDLDSDGAATAADLVRLVNHLDGSDPLSTELEPFADADRQNGVDAGDIDWIVRTLLGEVGLFATNPEVRFASSFGNVDEGDANAAIEVSLNGYIDGGTLSYQLASGSAESGVDFTNLTGSLVFSGSTVEIPIEIVDDLEREGVEFIDITLTSLPGFQVGLPARQRVFIHDNDRLWSGQLRIDEAILPIEAEIFRMGESVVGGRLISDGASTIPQGAFHFTSLILTEDEFMAESEPFDLDAADTLFAVPFTRTLAMSNQRSGEADASISLDPGVVTGWFEEAYEAPGAPHLSFVQEGVFILSEVPDEVPAVETDLVTVP